MQLSGAAEGVIDTVIRTLRRHWALALLLAAGLVLRVMTQLAYQPALIYIDSKKYVTNEWEGADPVGYTLLLLRPVLWFGNLMTVTVVQHLLGLAMAVTIYALLLRFGAPRWGAALATAPVLLDAYQLQAEQTIMPDVAFEVLALAGLVVLLWRRRPTLALAVTGGVRAPRQPRMASPPRARSCPHGCLRAAHPRLHDVLAVRAAPALPALQDGHRHAVRAGRARRRLRDAQDPGLPAAAMPVVSARAIDRRRRARQ
jgi:hypothetical protein